MPSRACRYFETMNRLSEITLEASKPPAIERTSRDQQSARQSFTRAIKKHRDNVCHSALSIHLSTNSIEQSISESETETFLDVNCHPPFDVLVLVLVSICHFSSLLKIRFRYIHFQRVF